MPRSVRPAPHDRRVEGPRGALVIEYYRPARGFFSVDRRLPPGGGATHARITEQDPDGRMRRQRAVTLAEVEAIVDAWSATGAAEAEGAPPVAAREVAAVTVVSRCPYCALDRERRGRKGFVERLSLGYDLSIDHRRTEYDVYACPGCGSIELFEPRDTEPSTDADA